MVCGCPGTTKFKKNVNEEIGHSGGYRADLRTQEKVRQEGLF